MQFGLAVHNLNKINIIENNEQSRFSVQEHTIVKIVFIFIQHTCDLIIQAISRRSWCFGLPPKRNLMKNVEPKGIIHEILTSK